jgi:hypothetical protein
LLVGSFHQSPISQNSSCRYSNTLPTRRRVSSRFFAEYLRPANLEASANTSCHYRIMVLGVKIPKQFLFEPQTESPLMPDEPEPLADHLSDRAVRAAKSADFFPKCFIYQWLGIFAPP